MLKVLAVSFMFWTVQTTDFSTPNNYFDGCIELIKQGLDKKIGETLYHITVLKAQVDANFLYLERTITRRFAGRNCTKLQALLLSPVMVPCRMEESFQVLGEARDKFRTLGKVACISGDLCGKLNPLSSQVSELERCGLDKILDLRRQISIVTREFSAVKAQLLVESKKCFEKIVQGPGFDPETYCD